MSSDQPDDIEDVLNVIRSLRDRADQTASALYEADPENNGRIAQRWADLAMMLDQTLEMDAGDDISDIDPDDLVDHRQNGPEEDLAEDATKPLATMKSDPWLDRY